MRAHGIAPRTRKKCRLLAQENARRHAWLTRSCFGRVVFQQRRPAFTTTLFPFSFFTKEKKKENRSKFSRFEYIARTHFVRPHDVRDWPRASSAEIYVAIATRFVRDCVEDLAVLTASMERISRCSWHIKDHYPGANKASRTSSYFYISLSSQNLSPQKFDFSQKI